MFLFFYFLTILRAETNYASFHLNTFFFEMHNIKRDEEKNIISKLNEMR